MPVVHVQDVRVELAEHGDLHGGAAEERKPLGVVAVFPAIPVIEARPVEEAVVLQKHELEVVVDLQDVDARPLHAGAERHTDEIEAFVEFEAQLPHLLAVVRHEDRDLVPAFCEGVRQRAGDVGEATCFGVGDRFACDP